MIRVPSMPIPKEQRNHRHHDEPDHHHYYNRRHRAFRHPVR